jgi:excinuclease UvrABC helicase subunit UvrB
MTEKQMNKLAEKIVSKLVELQNTYDKEFKQDLEKFKEENPDVEIKETTTLDIVNEEISRLNKRLKDLENNEDYEKAAIVSNKINNLKKRYNI